MALEMYLERTIRGTMRAYKGQVKTFSVTKDETNDLNIQLDMET